MCRLAEVNPGETGCARAAGRREVPVDGIVLESGRERGRRGSMLTGEAVPVAKITGDRVIGGTINGTGSFLMRAERVGSDSLLALIVAQVAAAQRSRAPIQALADRVSAWFVPAVFAAVAAVTFLAWSRSRPSDRRRWGWSTRWRCSSSPVRARSGLATPMAVMVGTGSGARAGVLVRDAEALQRLERVDTLCIDKTGTLTEGKPRVVADRRRAGFCRGRRCWRLGRQRSSARASIRWPTPLSRQRRKRAASPSPTAREFRSVAGEGVAASAPSPRATVVAIGNRDVSCKAAEGRAGADPAGDGAGHCIVAIAIDRKLCRGADLGRSGEEANAAAATAAALRAARCVSRLVMLSGDRREAAEAVARAARHRRDFTLGSCRRRARPRRCGASRAEGRTVAMAGDGVSPSAPALAAAAVGIAQWSTGADVALESAGVTLLKGDLGGILRARRLGRGTMRNIRQNLVLAFGFNALAIPIAAGVLYPATGLLLNPMIASAAMSASSLAVVGNAAQAGTGKAVIRDCAQPLALLAMTTKDCPCERRLLLQAQAPRRMRKFVQRP